MNDYNGIAWFYDVLARWVFQGNILKSQIHYLPKIQANDRVLIVGGGSGQMLDALYQLNIPLIVDFVEPSSQMIEKARKRTEKLPKLKLNFHESRIQTFKSSHKYDWVCCFFFLDLFKLKTLNVHLQHIRNLMHDQSRLMVADFQSRDTRFWQKTLSIVMHCFFKLTTSLESDRLKDIDELLIDCGFNREENTYFFSKFIFSAVYKKKL